MLRHSRRVVPGEEMAGKPDDCLLQTLSPLPRPQTLCTHTPGQGLEDFLHFLKEIHGLSLVDSYGLDCHLPCVCDSHYTKEDLKGRISNVIFLMKPKIALSSSDLTYIFPSTYLDKNLLRA